MLNEALILSRAKEIQRISNNSNVNKMAREIEQSIRKTKVIYSEEKIIEAIETHFKCTISDIICPRTKFQLGRTIYCKMLYDNTTDNRKVIQSKMKKKSVTSIHQYLNQYEEMTETNNQIFLHHLNAINTLLNGKATN